MALLLPPSSVSGGAQEGSGIRSAGCAAPEREAGGTSDGGGGGRGGT